MSIKFISVKCPECDAPLEIEEGRTQAFCSYCGAKIKIDNENEYFYHNIDEAKIKRAETEQLYRLRKLELEEKELKRKYRFKKFGYIFAILLFVIGMIMNSVSLEEDGYLLMAVGALIAEFNFLGSIDSKSE